MNDLEDLRLIDVESRIHERLVDAERERLARTSGAGGTIAAATARSAGGGRRRGSELARRFGERLIAIGTGIVEASRRFEPEPDEACRESPGAA
jgi:hypothetical protein